jgi:hypothetical protein
MTHRDHLLNLLDESGTLWIAPTILMHYIVPAHLLGGMLPAIGLLTRAAAIAQIPILLGAEQPFKPIAEALGFFPVRGPGSNFTSHPGWRRRGSLPATHPL